MYHENIHTNIHHNDYNKHTCVQDFCGKCNYALLYIELVSICTYRAVVATALCQRRVDLLPTMAMELHVGTMYTIYIPKGITANSMVAKIHQLFTRTL